MITAGEKLRREAGVPGHLLSKAAHPSFWYNSWKRVLARPKLGPKMVRVGTFRNSIKRQDKMGKLVCRNFFKLVMIPLTI